MPSQRSSIFYPSHPHRPWFTWTPTKHTPLLCNAGDHVVHTTRSKLARGCYPQNLQAAAARQPAPHLGLRRACIPCALLTGVQCVQAAPQGAAAEPRQVQHCELQAGTDGRLGCARRVWHLARGVVYSEAPGADYSGWGVCLACKIEAAPQRTRALMPKTPCC